MEKWSDWIDNDTVSAKHPPDLEPNGTVRVENGDRTISVGKAGDFNWTLILRYQIALPAASDREQQ